MSEIGITRARALSAEEISRFHEDGAAVLRGVLDSSWITRMQTAVDRSLAAPGEAAIEYTPKDKQGRYLGDFFMWIRDAEFRALMMDSPLPEVAAHEVERPENVGHEGAALCGVEALDVSSLGARHELLDAPPCVGEEAAADVDGAPQARRRRPGGDEDAVDALAAPVG